MSFWESLFVPSKPAISAELTMAIERINAMGPKWEVKEDAVHDSSRSRDKPDIVLWFETGDHIHTEIRKYNSCSNSNYGWNYQLQVTKRTPGEPVVYIYSFGVNIDAWQNNQRKVHADYDYLDQYCRARIPSEFMTSVERERLRAAAENAKREEEWKKEQLRQEDIRKKFWQG